MILLVLFSAGTARAQTPGDLERHTLQDAANGRLDGVFIVRALGGYVALPRTFVMLGVNGSSSIQFLVAMHPDSSLMDSGHAAFGLMNVSKAGVRNDVASGVQLPTHPDKVESRAAATVETFNADGGDRYAKVLLYVDHEYLLLTGSASLVADDIVKTYMALTGPPDFIAKYETVNTTSRTEAQSSECEAATIIAHNMFSTTDKYPWKLRVRSGPDSDGFKALGLSSDDMIVEVNGRPLEPNDTLLQMLRDAASGRFTHLSLIRSGTLVAVQLPQNASRHALVSCKK